MTSIFEERPTLDLNRQHFSHRHGDIMVVGSWCPTEDDMSEPCLFFMRPHLGRNMIRGIALSAAYLYDESNITYFVNQARSMAIDLGLGDSMASTARIGGLINNYLDELIKIPPMPKIGRTEVVGQFRLENLDTGKVIEDEINHHD
jgi:hypothetical protein